jgi:hypothetical protein
LTCEICGEPVETRPVQQPVGNPCFENLEKRCALVSGSQTLSDNLHYHLIEIIMNEHSSRCTGRREWQKITEPTVRITGAVR